MMVLHDCLQNGRIDNTKDNSNDLFKLFAKLNMKLENLIEEYVKVIKLVPFSLSYFEQILNLFCWNK